MSIFKHEAKTVNEENLNENLNPWAGLASYEDPLTATHKLKFCGREDESYDFAKLVMSNIFVTLYGKSGIGKTSLLNAGVFPQIRENGFTPISIRLGIRDEKEPKSYQSVIIEAIERNIPNHETINVIPEQTDAQKSDFLWNYFARHRFYTADGEPTSPVIVLDQFEELFRSNRDEVNMLLRQLDYLNDKDNTLDIDEADGKTYRYETNFRFVISIREDDLYRLEDSIDNCYLPALKRCRYRLRSLSDEGAKDVIVTPGEGLFVATEKESIVNKILDIARNGEDGSINTNILSLVCNRIYVDSRKNGNGTIGIAIVENFMKGNPFERFYNEATRKLSNKEKSYIEDSLVDSTGRRNSVSESDFLLNVPNGEMLLHGDNRILQRTSASSDSKHFRVELIHDSFCPPLMGLKEQREKKRKARIFAGLVSILLICIAIIVLIFSQQNKIMYSQSRLLGYIVPKLVEEGDGHTANKLALELFNGDYPYTTEAEVALRNASDANVFTLKGHTDVVKSVAFSPDGKYIASGSDDNTIKLWDVATGECVKTFEVHTNYVYSVAFSPDGKYIASGSSDDTIKLWDVAIGECVNTFEGHTDAVISVAFSPDGKYIASGSVDKTIKLWDVAKGECVKTFEGHANMVNSVAFSPDGGYIASGSLDNTIKLWDVAKGECVKTFEGHKYSVESVAFSPEGKFIASGSWDSTIKLWNVVTGECVKTIENNGPRVYSVAYSPDGKYVVSGGSNNEVKLWKINTGECINTFINHTSDIFSASFSTNGKFIASGSRDKTIKLWDVATGECVKTFEGHANRVNSVAFSPGPDGKYIASGSYDNTIKLWDVATGECVKTFEGYANTVNSVAFSSDGHTIASASDDHTIRLWEFPSVETILQRMRERYKGCELSKEERIQLGLE